jgi:hypothetical protein
MQTQRPRRSRWGHTAAKPAMRVRWRDEFENLRAAGQRVLISNMVDEMRQFERDWVCELYSQRGPFWDKVSAMRARWGITPPRQLPPSDHFLFSTYYPEPWTSKRWVMARLWQAAGSCPTRRGVSLRSG